MVASAELSKVYIPFYLASVYAMDLDKFFEFAQLLSQGIPFVRVDFYEADNQLFFGEMTFYPSSGMDRRTKAMDDYLNKHLDISIKK